MPIVRQQPVPGGLLVACVCGASQVVRHQAQGAAFAHAHQACRRPAEHYYGAGDMVAAATRAVGIKPCAPCKQRQAWLNRALPRVMRRR